MGAAEDLKKKIAAKIKEFEKKIQTPEVMKDIGYEATRRIVVRTRLGYGVESEGGPRQKLAPLKDSTVKSRRKKPLSSLTSPKRSNLTETGQLLDMITWRILNRSTIRIEPIGDRSDGESNANVARYAHEGSSNRPKRPFLFLTDTETKGVARFIRELLVKKLNR